MYYFYDPRSGRLRPYRIDYVRQKHGLEKEYRSQTSHYDRNRQLNRLGKRKTWFHRPTWWYTNQLIRVNF